MPNPILERIRQAVVEQHYTLSEHAYDEMDQDDLDALDVESALLTGDIHRTFTGDPPGARHEIIGTACDLSTRVGVVVRLLANGRVLIITVYQIG